MIGRNTMQKIIDVFEKERRTLIRIGLRMSICESLAQVAEESAELAQAALKLRRAIDGSNPTPKSIREATDAFNEELADVLLAAYVAGYDEGKVARIMRRKMTRWIERLEKGRCGNES
jgi:NTP pyrophosphatase (non-canonical NTP hydrolase)